MGNGNGARNPTQFWEPRGAIIKPHLFDATIAPQGLNNKCGRMNRALIVNALVSVFCSTQNN